MILTIIVFLFILSILVLIHEFGHFWVAKKLKIKVEEFAFGFPPKLFSIKKGETVYAINWLPIGGYVKLFGEDDAGGGKVTLKNKQEKIKPSDEKRAFYARSPWERALVVIAGVVMNAILAFLIYYVFFFIANFKTELPLLTNHTFFGVTQTNYNLNETDTVVSVVAPKSPIENLGMELPAKITAINNEPILERERMIQIVSENRGKEISIAWESLKTGEKGMGNVIPRVKPPENQGALGVHFQPIAVLEYKTFFQKVISGIVHPINLMMYNFDVMGELIRVSFKEKTIEPVSEGVSGPVGIANFVGLILGLGNVKEVVLNLLNLAGFLSISLAFFNVLPIPALDGGRLFFILIEGIFRKKVSQRIEYAAHTVGMAVLLTFIAIVTLKDIWKLFL